jgi:hypothetical protein
MRMVRTSTAIITGNVPTITLWIRSGILWLGEKTTTNENRYSDSGITHNSGIGVMSVVMKAVTPSMRLEGTNVSPIHRSRRRSVSPLLPRLRDERGVGGLGGAAPAHRVPRQRLRRLLYLGDARSRRAPQHHRRGEDEDEQQPVAYRPHDALGIERQLPLDQERVAEQPYDAAEVGGPVQEVGVPGGRVVGIGEPFLDKGVRRGDREKRKSYRHQQQPSSKKIGFASEEGAHSSAGTARGSTRSGNRTTASAGLPASSRRATPS